MGELSKMDELAFLLKKNGSRKISVLMAIVIIFLFCTLFYRWNLICFILLVFLVISLGMNIWASTVGLYLTWKNISNEHRFTSNVYYFDSGSPSMIKGLKSYNPDIRLQKIHFGKPTSAYKEIDSSIVVVGYMIFQRLGIRLACTILRALVCQYEESDMKIYLIDTEFPDVTVIVSNIPHLHIIEFKDMMVNQWYTGPWKHGKLLILGCTDNAQRRNSHAL